MILKLLPKQIPVFWNAIKTGAVQADEVDSKDLQPYLNELLHSLLSDKAQCFVVLSKDKVLLGLLVTRVQVDKITGDKYLLLQVLYVWEKMEDATWIDSLNLVHQFAKKEQCKYLLFNSRNSAIWDRTKRYGFVEKTRTYSLKI